MSDWLAKARKYPPSYAIRFALFHVIEAALTWVSSLRFRGTCLINGVHCGRSVRAFGRVVVRSPGGNIHVGDRVTFVSSSWRCTATGLANAVRLRTFLPTARIVIEDGVGINGGSITARSQTVRIGRDTMIGPDCLIMDSDFHVAWPPEERQRFVGTSHDAGVDIGRNVWLGARCIILKGVTIGDNAVVSAGSVVHKSIPANCLAAGNPARIVRSYDQPPAKPA